MHQSVPSTHPLPFSQIGNNIDDNGVIIVFSQIVNIYVCMYAIIIIGVGLAAVQLAKSKGLYVVGTGEEEEEDKKEEVEEE